MKEQAADSEQKEPPQQGVAGGVNPLKGLVLVVTVAALIVGANFVIFLRSEAYTTVQNLRRGSRSSHTTIGSTALGGAPNVSSGPLNGQEIRRISDELETLLDQANVKTDFAANELTDSALGL